MSATRVTVETYVSAWNATDEAERRRCLEQAWTDDGTYTDPSTHIAGREALVAYLARFARRYAGAQITLTSGVDAHHEVLRFAWRLAGADGVVVIEGTDFGEVAPDGRLRRIVGFFGPLPGKAEAEW